MPGDGDERETKLLEERPVRQFTWKELSQLNRRENAHVAYRGKVSLFIARREGIVESYILFIFRYMMLVVSSLNILEVWIK